MTAVWPFLAASCRAVPKMLSVAWTSAPALRSALTVAVSPFRAASCRTSPNAGLVLARIMMTTTVCVREIFMLSPFVWSRPYARGLGDGYRMAALKSLTIAVSSRISARDRAVQPWLSLVSTFAPASRSALTMA